MELTRKQEEGLKIAVARYKANEPYTVISGYAGTGKSTLVKFIVSALDLIPEEDVAYITFTGKASEVLREKGCPNAMTAHRLLYYSKQMPNGNYMYTPRPHLEGDYQLIVVDEISMLPADMWELLLTHGVYVLAVGDPFQIPPIDKKQDNHVLDMPHIFLDEVMRQAKESDIITLSMDIRAGKQLEPMKGNDAQVYHRQDLVDGMYYWADQIITATNRSRFDVNTYMREQAQRGKEPEIGDKIICLRNCWELASDWKHDPLINGTIGYVKNLTLSERGYILDGQLIKAPILFTTIEVSDDTYTDIPIDYKALTTGEKFFTPKQEYAIRKLKRNPELPVEFNYGYAITAHKAQGSQWDKVLVMEETFPFSAEEHARWLYTACTRPSEKLTLVLK